MSPSLCAVVHQHPRSVRTRIDILFLCCTAAEIRRTSSPILGKHSDYANTHISRRKKNKL